MIERALLNENTVTVVGTLVDASANASTSKDGNDYVRGKVSIKSNGKTIELNFFTMKMTKTGAVSKLYNTYMTLGDLKGKRVEVTGYIDEAKVPTNGTIRRGNSLYLRFVKVLSDTDTTPDVASFKISGFIQEGLKAVYNEDGATIKDYNIVVGQSDYKREQAKQFRFNVDPANQAAIDGMNQKFTVGTSAVFAGNLEFDIETKVTQIEQDFGPAITKTNQYSTKRYVITSGSVVVDDTAYTQDEIKILLAGAAEDDKKRLSSRQGTGATVSTQTRTTAQPKLI